MRERCNSSMSRLGLFFGILLLRADVGELQVHERYQRTITTSGVGGNCAVLDPQIFAHAAESLRDLRLIGTNGAELPYVITVSGTAIVENVTAPVRNIVQHGGVLAFDLEMPSRPYTDVLLDLADTDFVATASVNGRQTMSSGTTQLGTFAIFDLNAQHLPRSTVLHLLEITLPLLHVELRTAPGSRALRPEMLRGATVPPSREAQTLYTTAVSSSDVQQRGQQTVVRFNVARRVPIERAAIFLLPGFHGDFNRTVQIEARAVGRSANSLGSAAGEVETLTGVIARLHLVHDGALLTADRMTVPATLGANLQTAAAVEVAIDNGTNAPLPVRSVDLGIRERRVCFDVPADVGALTLFYGDPGMEAPDYGTASRLSVGASSPLATMGPEQLHPAYAKRTDRRSLTRRHPRLISLGLLLVICLGGVVALRSAKLRL